MMLYKVITVYCVLAIVIVLAEKKASSPEDLLDICIDSRYHKKEPGPEGSLLRQCTPWKDYSCCTQNTTAGIHNDILYNFNYNHCSNVQTMSLKCRSHFIQDHCFYECSPNVGPWIVKETRSWRRERYYGIPLCAADCKRWFEDCQNDYTCTDNWSKNFEWRDGTCKDGRNCKTNFCPQNSRCHTFKQVYETAKTFCETVFDGSWTYTEGEPCMKMWFSGKNPNSKVAELKASSLFSNGYKTDFNIMTLFALLLVSGVNVAST